MRVPHLGAPDTHPEMLGRPGLSGAWAAPGLLPFPTQALGTGLGVMGPQPQTLPSRNGSTSPLCQARKPSADQCLPLPLGLRLSEAVPLPRCKAAGVPAFV